MALGKLTKIDLAMLTGKGPHLHPLIWNAELDKVEISIFPLVEPSMIGRGVFALLDGDTMRGQLSSKVASNPTSIYNLVNKDYVDSKITDAVSGTDTTVYRYVDETFVKKSGDTMTGPLEIWGTPSKNLHALSKGYGDGTYLRKFGVAFETTEVPIVYNGPILGQSPNILITKDYLDSAINVVTAGLPPPSVAVSVIRDRAEVTSSNVELSSGNPLVVTTPLIVTNPVPMIAIIAYNVVANRPWSLTDNYTINIRCKLNGNTIRTIDVIDGVFSDIEFISLLPRTNTFEIVATAIAAANTVSSFSIISKVSVACIPAVLLSA